MCAMGPLGISGPSHSLVIAFFGSWERLWIHMGESDELVLLQVPHQDPDLGFYQTDPVGDTLH